ncbi:TetR family transcriptional regulator [Streptomyces sp. E-15]
MSAKGKETRARTLDAATSEFAEHGIAGARVECITRAAACNKNLLYVYFGSKETLFGEVIARNLTCVYDGQPFTPEDLPAYAARVCRFAADHPKVMRLLAWAALELHTSVDGLRTAAQRRKTEMLCELRPADSEAENLPPGFLITAVVALSTAWSVAGPFATTTPRSLDIDALCRAVSRAVSALTASAPAEGPAG